VKQSEINKVVRQIAKSVGKNYQWKSSSGFLFCKKGLLLFSLIILGHGKNRTICDTLYYKLYDFDEIFWKIVGLEENLNQPLSFRVAGVWTAPMVEVYDSFIENDDWSESNLSCKIKEIIQKADNMSSEIAQEITDLDKNIQYTEGLFAKLQKDHPGSLINIDKEKLLTAILKKEYSLVTNMADEMIAKNNSGGFNTGSKSFYMLAKEYIERESV
jgi:hypothetical protein